MAKLIEEFKNPGSDYRGAPFWAWNGKLCPEELRRQIRLMHKMGLGGFFMHSRVGLATPYLSEEWFECINACVDEAEKLDMNAWLYDEDRWPSGAAGGLVTKNPKYRMRRLYLYEVNPGSYSKAKITKQKNILKLFLANVIDDKTLKDYKEVSLKNIPKSLGKKQKLLIFKIEEDEKSSWYNGYTYLDTLSHEAVREFIRVTHKKYEKELGEKLGKRVPGIFTDEPNYSSVCCNDKEKHRYLTPWTNKLPETFRKRYGYDILSVLPEIFFAIKTESQVSKVSYHYIDCITFLFVDAFARQIGEWCEKTGMLHTGHVLAEDTLTSQTSLVGSTMRFYEYMQAPGMDLLTEYWRIYDTAKQVSSVANQFDRKWRLTETYGCTGWQFPFVGHKALGDWQAALGINLRCQHLSWYTMEGQAKRDYPASIFYQSPWWELYGKVEDYFARIFSLMTKGKEIREVLVLHPVESIWTMVGKEWQKNPMVKKLDKQLIKLRDILLKANIDFDYGDEDIISRHAKVVSGDANSSFIINKAQYKAVVIPDMITMRSSTLKLLKEFRKKGGTVIFAGNIPEYVDAEKSSLVKSFAAECIVCARKPDILIKSLEKTINKISILSDNKEIESTLYLFKEDKSNFYLFICNTGHTPSHLKPDNIDKTMVVKRNAEYPAVTLKIKGITKCKTILDCDAETGNIYSANYKMTNSGVEIYTDLPALGSRLFVIPKTSNALKELSPSKKEKIKYPRRPLMKGKYERELNRRTWDIMLSEDNVLVLDYAEYKIGKKSKWNDEEEILQIDRKIRTALGVQVRGGMMTQPWAVKKSKDEKNINVELKYSFEVTDIPQGPLYIAIENPSLYSIRINEHDISIDMECGWWCDKSLRKIYVNPAFIKRGINTILLQCNYKPSYAGLEIIYILGNFGVKFKNKKPTLIKPVSSLKLGDWVPQGLPFYSGSVSYITNLTIDRNNSEYKRILLRIPQYEGSVIRVWVNDKQSGILAWPPYVADITEYIKNGVNKLKIELFSHRRNSHGPFHIKQKYPRWTGPTQYVPEKHEYQKKHQLVPCGLKQPPVLIFVD